MPRRTETAKAGLNPEILARSSGPWINERVLRSVIGHRSTTTLVATDPESAYWPKVQPPATVANLAAGTGNC